MNIKTLLANLHTFPVVSQNDDNWTYNEAVSALYGEMLGFEVHDADLDGFGEMSNLTLHKVFDFQHNSDEACFALVMSYKSTPFGLVYKFGDTYKTEYAVLDRGMFVEVGKLLAAYRLEQTAKEKAVSLEHDATPLTALSELPNQYMTWVSDEVGLFSMNSPRWMFRFSHMLIDYAAVLQQEDGSLREVTQIVGFKVAKPGWVDKEADVVEVLTDDGRTQFVHGKELAFFLVRPENPVEAARCVVNRKTEWAFAGTVNVRDQWMIRCDQYQEGHLGSKRISAILPNPKDKPMLLEFVAKHHVGRHEGMFVAPDFGFEPL